MGGWIGGGGVFRRISRCCKISSNRVRIGDPAATDCVELTRSYYQLMNADVQVSAREPLFRWYIYLNTIVNAWVGVVNYQLVVIGNAGKRESREIGDTRYEGADNLLTCKYIYTYVRRDPSIGSFQSLSCPRLAYYNGSHNAINCAVFVN